ncbi:MAG TPA: M20/M25/M40 family metallo-hydrolase [Bryobacteraceae bacterium]|nr:M20/M25/M40 family metallo-hydrolase [Bryobacteraceae bacterium]
MRTLLFLLATGVAALAEEKVDLTAVHRIKTEAFQHSKVMEHAFYLTDVYGPRLTGSPGLKAAADWAVKRFGEWGLSNAGLEPWGPFGRGWSQVRFSAHLKEPQYSPLIGFSRPWSPGTNGPVAAQPMLAVIESEADMDKFRGKLKGRIVLLDPPRQLEPHTSVEAKTYSDADLAAEMAALRPSTNAYNGSATESEPRTARSGSGPRSRTGQLLRGEALQRYKNKLNQFLIAEGALVAITPGTRTDGGTVLATGAGSHEEKNPLPIPSVAISAEQYNRIARLLEKKIPVTLEFDIQNKFHEAKEAFNVVAELPGTDKKDQVVMLGAHLDSWTGGTGATDNAAGSAVVMEAMRILKSAGFKPRRTVRIALWTGEEEGLLGSKAYVKEHFADRETMTLKPEHAKLAGYFNLDNGSGKIRGVFLQSNDMARPVFEAWLAPFRDLGATALSIRNTSGTDHLSFDAVGLPGFQFIQDPVEYETRTHHTNMDVYDRLQRTDLMQASAIMASFVYHAAMRDEMLPRKPLPPAQQRTGTISDVTFTKAGDQTLTLDAYVPQGTGPFPAAIVVHGGGFTRGDKQTYVKPLFDPLTEGGFAWFTINYRLAPKFRYPAAVEDVEAAIRYVRRNAKQYKVDPERIALIGESAGGHLVSMAGARNRADSKVKAVVSFYGPHDLERRAVEQKEITESIRDFLGVAELNPKSIKVLHDASPINHIAAGMPPYLLIHGTKDEKVPYDQSPKMCQAMRAAGGACDLFTVEEGQHGMGGWEKAPAQQKYKIRMIEWLKETLN